MGVGQSSALGLVGTLTGAALAASKLGDMSEKEDLKIEEGLLAQEHLHEANAAITNLTGQSEEAGKTLEAAKTALGRTKEGSKANQKRLGELEAAQRAFDELQERIAAKEALKLRSESIIKRTGGIK